MEGSGSLDHDPRDLSGPGDGAGDRQPRLSGRSLAGWILLIVAPMLVCGLVAFLVSTASVSIYAARAQIVFQAPADRDVTEQYRATQTVMLTGRTVLGQVSRTREIEYESLVDGLKVSFPNGGSIMELEFADRDRARALAALNAIIDRYLVVLDQVAGPEEITHRVLVPPFVDEQPVSPKPLQAAALGLVVGLAISLGALALLQRVRFAP